MSYSTRQILALADANRPRSRQAEIGMSELGGCRRRAKYRLEGIAPSDDGFSMEAILGTMLHEIVARQLTLMQLQGLIPAEDLIESEVRFDGVDGHLDHYESDTLTIVDTKTLAGQYRVNNLELYGLPQSWRFQTAMYAAGLIKRGYRVRWVKIDAITRDHGVEWTDVRPFDVQDVQDAKTWADNVRSTPLEETERDYDPGSAFCANCPFRTLCWGESESGKQNWGILWDENPDLRDHADALITARAAQAREKREADKARDALMRVDRTGVGNKFLLDVGWDGELLCYSRYKSERIDEQAVREMCAAAGVEVPMKVTWPTKIYAKKKPVEDQQVEDQPL